MGREFTSLMLVVLLSVWIGALQADNLKVSEEGKFDFGHFPAWENRTHTFILSNISQKPIKIQKVRSTCGCLIGRISAKEILPGNTMEIQTQIKANSVEGEFVKTIYVETDMPEQRFVRLELRGEAQSLIEIKPASPFYAGKLKADHEYQFQFELLPTRDNIELSVTADSNCRLMRHGSKWIAICTLTPKADSMIIEKKFYINVVSPEKQLPLCIHIRAIFDC